MNCRDYRALMQPFLADELEEKKTKQLLTHLNDCQECKEEIKIQYLVKEGMERLETGRSFDFQKEFNEKMNHAIKHNKIMLKTHLYIAYFQIIAVVFVVIVLLRAVIFGG